MLVYLAVLQAFNPLIVIRIESDRKSSLQYSVQKAVSRYNALTSSFRDADIEKRLEARCPELKSKIIEDTRKALGNAHPGAIYKGFLNVYLGSESDTSDLREFESECLFRPISSILENMQGDWLESDVSELKRCISSMANTVSIVARINEGVLEECMNHGLIPPTWMNPEARRESASSEVGSLYIIEDICKKSKEARDQLFVCSKLLIMRDWSSPPPKRMTFATEVLTIFTLSYNAPIY